jgi:hypothetical protein
LRGIRSQGSAETQDYEQAKGDFDRPRHRIGCSIHSTERAESDFPERRRDTAMIGALTLALSRRDAGEGKKLLRAGS